MAVASFPARCAVAVICDDHLVSQVYPAGVPIEVYLDNVVELLNDDLKRRGAKSLDPNIAYELKRVNGTRLDVTKTLDELGIEDGSTLVLTPAERGDSFEPQYESLSTGLARVGKRLFEPVTTRTAAMTALVIAGLATLTTLGLAFRTRAHTDSWQIALVILILAVGLASGALFARRVWPARWELSSVLAWLAIPLTAAGFAAAAPGDLGSAQVFIGALGTAALSCGLVTVTGRTITLAATIVTLCAIGASVAAVRMWQPVPAQVLGMCTMIGLLVLVTAGPTIALWVARIRPPHFGSITGRDLFRRGDGMAPDAVAPVDDDAEEPESDATPRGLVIAAAARRANSVLTGLCTAVALAMPVASWTLLMPGEPRGTGAAILLALFVMIFISRGRAFADRRQAVALVIGAAAAVCAGVARYILHSPSGEVAPWLYGTLLLSAFTGAGLVAALLVPATRFTPLVRMAAEWAELAAIVIALPTAAWVGGLFTWMRMR